MRSAGLVEKQLAYAFASLAEGNSGKAETVVSGDYPINALEVEIDEECNRILALRQPAASDLRFIVAVIKTITDLERMGDEAERIGLMALELADRQPPKNRYGEIRHLGQTVQGMVHGALDAFARTDADAAVMLLESDRIVDRDYDASMRQMITLMMENLRHILRSLETMWSARSLERIADRACNICEYVIYLVKGEDIRHTSWDTFQAELRGAGPARGISSFRCGGMSRTKALFPVSSTCYRALNGVCGIPVAYKYTHT